MQREEGRREFITLFPPFDVFLVQGSKKKGNEDTDTEEEAKKSKKGRHCKRIPRKTF